MSVKINPHIPWYIQSGRPIKGLKKGEFNIIYVGTKVGKSTFHKRKSERKKDHE